MSHIFLGLCVLTLIVSAAFAAPSSQQNDPPPPIRPTLIPPVTPTSGPLPPDRTPTIRTPVPSDPPGPLPTDGPPPTQVPPPSVPGQWLVWIPVV